MKWRCAALLAGMLCAISAPAQTQLAVDVGWDNLYRMGRWNPVFITAADQTPQAVAMEVYAPHDAHYALRLLEIITVDPNPRTVPLYLPLSNALEQTTVTVRSGLNPPIILPLANPDFSPANNRLEPQMVDEGTLFIGLSGAASTMPMVRGQLQGGLGQVGYLPMTRLPEAPVGYEPLDLLVLNQPDLGKISDEQQQAMLQWVRAGGALVLWPGAEPLPPTGPIIDALPCRFGDNRIYEINSQKLKATGLPERFTKLKGRSAVPMPGAEKVSVLDGTDLLGYRGQTGFGRILVLPVDVSTFHFDNAAKSQTFWRRLLTGVAEIPVVQNNSNGQPTVNYTMGQRQAAAMTHAMNWLADVPGAGKFGFSYLAAVLILMMVVVGPVDWYVLKLLGKQPWTWVTTSGWIGLFTLGAIGMGHVIRSGDLHFRTVSVIDEADGLRVMASDLMALYSPGTLDHDLTCDRESWWRPATEEYGWARGGMMIEIPGFQDHAGCRPGDPDHPGRLRVNIWNLRFLRSTSYALAPPMIEAKLALTSERNISRITGTISNKSAVTLSDIVIRAQSGVAKLPGVTLAPGQSAPISLPLDPRDRTFDPQNLPGWEGRFGNHPQTDAVPGTLLLANLPGSRELQVDRALRSDRKSASIYAQFHGPAATVELADPTAKRDQIGLVRSLTKME